ncbi:hypothetical protein PR048_009067 [Dryococelus australis]|uniref:Reverse transcriptase RNase H-like domain-containing protein n=1 Tax=Dryococelus australis TaxID=614101 RepID=A0ABQ9I0P8_9NEOP|nr:hypothetical protein PR048_009067 [Dryococelus australis]
MDASSTAMGAVLSQEIDGQRQPIAFAFRTLMHLDHKTSLVNELLCLEFIGLGNLWNTKNFYLKQTIRHCHVKASSLKFKIQHIRGTQNNVADALSHMFDNFPEKTISKQEINVCCAFLTDFSLAFQDIEAHQNASPFIKGIIDLI